MAGYPELTSMPSMEGKGREAKITLPIFYLVPGRSDLEGGGIRTSGEAS